MKILALLTRRKRLWLLRFLRNRGKRIGNLLRNELRYVARR